MLKHLRIHDQTNSKQAQKQQQNLIATYWNREHKIISNKYKNRSAIYDNPNNTHRQQATPLRIKHIDQSTLGMNFKLVIPIKSPVDDKNPYNKYPSSPNLFANLFRLMTTQSKNRKIKAQHQAKEGIV
ncbi:hypothetical protein TTHERM_00561380 (macronuclear) [Tetrahymena thermophila SB210]|uniref:Uncharacterized protein n=1 Tax=Tetrahymena thermophila (strain SB210) TaxID=312017 RepID=I7M766_TETTS|nr:hypothetical protein TTHERM_00561380 [Tetrahymena thermophila SB210]EAR89947.1 hypothetical protein TTHERM_00561380 [Tetrahymena thermophila SB210]|eukprot:XP_001010192.1 hypothetical protein TTHERM_00561380 [Tetrahymena thermophila SB210]